MADKLVVKKTVVKPKAVKRVTNPVSAKPVAVAKVAAPKPVVAKPVEAPKPVAAAPVVAKIAVPAPAVAKVEAPKPVVATAPVKTPEPVKAPIIAEGKSIMNDTVAKVQETAEKFTAEATARANEMFGDVSARAKTAMEKGSKVLEEAVDFSKGNLEAVVASGRVAAKGAQDIAKYSADYGRKAIEDANATAKQFAAVKSPTEFFQLQSDIAKKNLDAAVAETSKFTESYLKLLGEIVQPLQNRYAVAVEKVKTAVAA